MIRFANQLIVSVQNRRPFYNMLTALRTKNTFSVPAFLALCYFVIGVHAVHFHFHTHQESGVADHHEHCCHAAKQYGPTFTAPAPLHQENHSCPICSFLAAKVALYVPSNHLVYSTLYHQQVDCNYLVVVIPLDGSAGGIRGPPTELNT